MKYYFTDHFKGEKQTPLLPAPPPHLNNNGHQKQLQQTPKHLSKRKSYMKYTIKFNLFKFKRLSFDFFN